MIIANATSEPAMIRATALSNLISAGQDQCLHGLDQLGRPAGAVTDPAQDDPALELSVCPFPGSARAAVCGVDLLLVARQAPVAAGVGVQPSTTLRHGDPWPAAPVGGV